MSKRAKGQEAVKTMARYMPLIEIQQILRELPCCAFTNGALEQLIDLAHPGAGITVKEGV